MENKKGTEAQKMTREDFAVLWRTIYPKDFGRHIVSVGYL